MWVKKAAIGCIIVSVGAHAAAMMQVAPPDDTFAAASPPPALVSAGNSFADMVMGAPDAMQPEVVEPTETPPEFTPAKAPSLAPTEPATITLEPDELTATQADVLASEPTSVAPTPIAPAEPETLEALPDVQVENVTADTVRPPTRPADLGKTPPPPPPRQTATARNTTPAPTGDNAPQDARRGAATANAATSQAASQGQGQQANQAAVAAAQQATANYPNQVMRKISRARRERTRARGVALVSFSIGGGGQLTGARIARSSGSADLDQIAINHIRRAAPFPAPPAGARTSFSFEFQGR